MPLPTGHMPLPNWVKILACCAGTVSLSTINGCTTVKPYQRAYINDVNMKLGKLDIEKFDENVQTYREGASGGGNGKPSGGCGCN